MQLSHIPIKTRLKNMEVNSSFLILLRSNLTKNPLSLQKNRLGFIKRSKKITQLKQERRVDSTIWLLSDVTQKQRVLQWNIKIIAWVNYRGGKRLQKSSYCRLEWNDFSQTIDCLDNSIKDKASIKRGRVKHTSQ